MIRAKSALAAAGALMLAGALAAGVAHAAGPADRPAAAHPAPTSWVGSWERADHGPAGQRHRVQRPDDPADRAPERRR
jgi:hypothetical protein